MDIKLSKDYTGSRDGAPRKIRRVALKLDKFPLEIWRSGKKVQPPKGFRLQKGIYYTPGSVFPAEVDRISEDLSIQGLTVAVCTGPIHAGRGASYKIYAWKEKGMKETKSKGIRWSVQDQKDGICPICHDGDMGEDYDDDGHRYLYHTQCDFYSYEWEELTGNTLEEKSMKEAAGKYRLRITTWQEDQLKRKNIVFNAKDEKMGGLKALTIAALGGEKLSNVPKEEMLEIMTEIESDMERYGFSAADYAAQMYGEELTMRLISPTGEVLINSDSEDDEAEEDYDESVEARIDRLTEKELEVVEQRLGIKRESSGDEYQLLLDYKAARRAGKSPEEILTDGTIPSENIPALLSILKSATPSKRKYSARDRFLAGQSSREVTSTFLMDAGYSKDEADDMLDRWENPKY